MVRSVSLNLQQVFGPLSVNSFRAMWIASFCMNTGLFIQDLGSAWLMTSLSQNPLMVASLQTAALSPFILLALPAGAGADLVDRRRLLQVGQTWLILVAATMAVLTLTGHMNAWLLLALIFMLALGNAFNSPAWNVALPSIVPRNLFEPTIGLLNAGYHLARGSGAILGGMIVASFGPGWAFAVCSVCLAYMATALHRWQYTGKTSETDEHLIEAIKTGLQYARHSPVMKTVLVRTALYMIPVSVLWSLVPLLARKHLHINSGEYGFIVAAFGFGTLVGTFVQQRLRQKGTLDGLSAAGTLLFSAAFLLLAATSQYAIFMFAMMLCGIGWNCKSAALNVCVQLSAPPSIRARAYSVYLLGFQGCLASGAFLWGTFACFSGLSAAFGTAAALMLLDLAARRRFALSTAIEPDAPATVQPRRPEPAVHSLSR